MSGTPTVNRGLKVTDDTLRREMLAGLKPADIARKYGVSRQAISKRVNQLELTTQAAMVAPRESQRFVAASINVMEQLARNVHRANLLMDACDEWLRDVEDPSKYDVSARAEELDVTYEVEVEYQVKGETRFRTERRKKRFTELVAYLEGCDEDGARFAGAKHGETKRADPRELILKTQAETRHTAALVIEAMQKVTEARILQDFHRACIEEIGKESPECAQRIAERLQRSIVLHAAFAGAGALPSPAAESEPN